ncbi:uncharacterized protein [Clytia hemisphaerica]|uniref:uncharacterized protein n=1 Tax=Clytia hemisphaerica TaxID=252671 RepID=UPI0034D5E954
MDSNKQEKGTTNKRTLKENQPSSVKDSCTVNLEGVDQGASSLKKQKLNKSCQHCKEPLNINACQKCGSCGKKQNKCCQHCREPMPSNACKKCSLCGMQQSKLTTTTMDDIPKGKVDLCQQKNIIRKRLNTLNKRCNSHCVVLYLSGEQRVHVDGYATPGFATHFMESLVVENNVVFGDVIKETLKMAYKDYRKSQSVVTTPSDEAETLSDNVETPSSEGEAPSDVVETPSKTVGPGTERMSEDNTTEMTTVTLLFEDSDVPQRCVPNETGETTQNVIVSAESTIEEAQCPTQTELSTQGSSRVEASNIVEGVIELSKGAIKKGMIVPVYADPSHQDSFWLSC